MYGVVIFLALKPLPQPSDKNMQFVHFISDYPAKPYLALGIIYHVFSKP